MTAKVLLTAALAALGATAGGSAASGERSALRPWPTRTISRVNHLFPTVELYSTDEAAALAGCSYRQLDYWRRQRVVTPTREPRGQGSRCRWTFQDVRAVAAAMTLRSFGLSLPAIRRALDEADRRGWQGTLHLGHDGRPAKRGQLAWIALRLERLEARAA